MTKTNPTYSHLSTLCSGELKTDRRIFYRNKMEKMSIQLADDDYLRLSSLFVGQRANLFTFLFAAFEAANFQIDFFGNPVMRTTE